MSETTSRPIIEIENLVKSFGLLPVLRKLSLEVHRGEFLALLGPNGSGKSTLLRLLMGLSRPTAGRIAVGGWEIPKEAAAVRAQIGVVSHKSLLYENLTARENLRFFGRLYAIQPAELNTRIDRLLKQVGLEKRGDDLTRTFSRGMQQRLSIARALIHNPHVLLFDEPYTGLDQQAASTLDTLLQDARSEGQTTIMVTHQIERAARLASRVIILNRGRVGFDADASTIDTSQLASTYADITGAATTR